MQLFNTLNHELNIISDWFKANKLSLNISKTNYMLFSTNKINVEHYKIKLCDRDIEQTSSTKFLGIYIDSKLKWDVHINSVTQKISRSSYAINKIKDILPKHHLKLIYNSIVYPYLSYGIVIWGAAYKTHLDKLRIQQKKIIRRINGAQYDAHSEPIFKELNFLKIEDIYKVNAARHILSLFQGSLPSSLSMNYINTQNIHRHNTRHRTTFKLTIPLIRTNIASQCITFRGPQLWNAIS